MVDPQWAHLDFARDHGAVIYDYQLHRLFRISIAPDGSPKVEDQAQLSLAEHIRSPVVRRGTIVSNGYFSNETLVELTDGGKRIRTLSVDPPASAFRGRVSMLDAKYHLNRNRAAVSPDGRRLVLAYQSANRFDAFEGAQYLYSWRGPEEVKMQFSLQSSRNRLRWKADNQFAYVGVAASDNYIYGLFCGDCANRGELAHVIDVFSWSGLLQYRLNLDLGIETLAVDRNDTILYGSITEPHPAIGAWNLPKTP
jgi:hypothetical protein